MDVYWAGQLAEQLDWPWKAQLRPLRDLYLRREG
jgi:hypothetical protein